MPTRFAVLHYCAYLQEDGYILEFYTNIPCHLWLNYTNVKPVTHMEPVLKRGLEMHCNPRFCFVAIKYPEQNEEGDTLTHSFWLKELNKWDDIWCYLIGNIGGLGSPSTSAIMHFPLDMRGASEIIGEVGFEDSGKAVSYNRPRAQRIKHDGRFTCTGVKLFCYGFGPDYRVRVSIYKSDFFEFPTGSYLTSQTFLHIPWKRTWPRVGYMFFTFPPVRLEWPHSYHIVVEGDPAYPDTDVFWWSRGNLPPAKNGQVAHYGERSNGAIIWRRDLDSFLDFEAWVNTGYYQPCEGDPIPAVPEFYEPWGSHLNQYNFWLPQPVLTPPLISFADSIITLENTGETAQWIHAIIATTYPPIQKEDGSHMYFYYDSPLSTGNPVTHWHSYVFRFWKQMEEFTLEGVISNGNLWPPWNGRYAATPAGGAFFVGTGAGSLDLVKHFSACRTFLGLDPNPIGWKLSACELRIEDFNANPGGKLKNDYLLFVYP